MRILASILILLPLCLHAQTPIRITPGSALQFQVQQPGVDTQTPVFATATFDPPVIHVGQKAWYRAQFNATEAAIQWPDPLPSPDGLTFSSDTRGQTMQFLAGNYRPFTGFDYEIVPDHIGHFTITNFTVNVDGQPVTVPSASLEVVADNVPVPPPGRKVFLMASDTNLYLGQPFLLSVILPSTPSTGLAALNEVQINGDGLIPDKTAMRYLVQPLNLDSSQPLVPSWICEIPVTPMATGPLDFSVQGFTSSPRFVNGTITITGPAVINAGLPSLVFLMSDPMEIHVRPLPTEGRLPGFTGSIGQFYSDPVRLSTNSMSVGEPVHLRLSIHGLGDLTRLVPPLTPQSRDWQIIPDEPPDIGFTLIPLADDVSATPEIPYSYFDPSTGTYEDLTVAPISVTVTGQGLPAQLSAIDITDTNNPVKLSGLAVTPGLGAGSLKPLQMQGWFIVLQLLPIAGYIALLRWDKHRRFLETHPEIVRRRRARRALRLEKRRWRRAIAAGDAPGFVQSAANAMKIACAPHFPADPRALVCADILSQLDRADQDGYVGQTVRQVFNVVDARFAAAPGTAVDLLALEPKVDTVLMKLEEKL